jgi:hypothetical protein
LGNTELECTFEILDIRGQPKNKDLYIMPYLKYELWIQIPPFPKCNDWLEVITSWLYATVNTLNQECKIYGPWIVLLWSINLKWFSSK